MNERIFVIDQDVKVRDFLYELFSGVGCRVKTLPAGKELISELKNERPMLIFLEDAPVEFSGIDLAKKIREFDKDIEIIFLGKEIDRGISSQLKDVYVSTYLKKDFENPEVIKNILMLLKQRHACEMPCQNEKIWGHALVIDDEIENSSVMKRYLEKRGFMISCARSGEEGLEMIRTKNFDVVLLDMSMEGMDGLLALKRIKDVQPGIKVVMVTSTMNPDVIKEARVLGASDYVLKPTNFSMLESTLLSLLVLKKVNS
jgi:CheY-like chemotaxis protein